MLKIYNWRKNFSSTVYRGNESLYGKVAVKTKSTHWLDVPLPAVIYISIHSAFHEGLDGHLKMRAFISVIKEHVKGPLTILMTEKAHLQAQSLLYDADVKSAYTRCRQDATVLARRFQDEFDGCRIAYWDSYLSNDPFYRVAREKVVSIYKQDRGFRSALKQDTSIKLKSRAFFDPQLYLSKTVEDILEQCVGLLVLIEKGYHFVFYPGPQYKALEYLNQSLGEDCLEFVHTFVSIEKKKRGVL